MHYLNNLIILEVSTAIMLQLIVVKNIKKEYFLAYCTYTEDLLISKLQKLKSKRVFFFVFLLKMS